MHGNVFFFFFLQTLAELVIFVLKMFPKGHIMLLPTCSVVEREHAEVDTVCLILYYIIFK